MLAEEHLLPHVLCRVFTCGNLCEKKQKNQSIELNTKHSDISTKVGPEENHEVIMDVFNHGHSMFR